jgi:hypothetical protein
MMLVVLGILAIYKNHAFPGWWALLPTIGTVLIISSGPKAWLNQNVLSNRLLVGVGLISYPLYLWHWPLLSFTRIVQGQEPNYGTRIVIILISFVLAWLTFKLIENTFRFGGQGPAKTVFLLVLMSFVGFLGYFTYQQEGFPFREIFYENTSVGWDGGASEHLMDDCELNNGAEKALFALCIQDVRATPKYALLGDSKASALYRGLLRTSTDNGRWLVIGGNGPNGAPVPVLSENTIYSSHQRLTNIAIDSIVTRKNIETVVLVAATRSLFKLKNTHSIEDLPSSKNYDAALEGLINVVNKFIEVGQKVVIVVDNPTLADPKDCFKRKTSSAFLNEILATTPNEHCQIELSRHLELSKQYIDLLLEVRSRNPGNIVIFDTTEYLCDKKNDICLSHKNGYPLYAYSDHVSDYAAGLIGVELNEFLNNN